MISVLFLILCIFSIIFVLTWAWFFKNEKDFCENMYAAGLKRLEAGKYLRAKLLFQRVLLMDSKYKAARFNLGVACFNLNDYNLAQNSFEQVLSDSPKDFDATFFLAQTLQLKRNYETSAEVYLKAIELNDKCVDCYFNLGFVYYKQAKYEQALEYLNKANTMHPENERILFYINRCKDELCSYDEVSQGLEIIDEYLSISDTSNLPKDFHLLIARAYAKVGMIDKSEEYCKISLSEDTEDIESYKLLGLIRLIKKDFIETKSLLSTALHLQPKNKELHNLLSYVLCYQVDDCGLNRCREKYYKLMRNFLK